MAGITPIPTLAGVIPRDELILIKPVCTVALLPSAAETQVSIVNFWLLASWRRTQGGTAIRHVVTYE